jgi:type IV secretory pathway VirB10-like protein
MATNNWVTQLLTQQKQKELPVAPVKPGPPMPDKGIGPPTPVRPFPRPPLPKTPPRPNIKAKKPKPKAKKKPKKRTALDKWLAGDTTYQQQTSAFNKEWSDYVAQYSRQGQVVNRDYGTTQRQMNKQAVDDRTQQANDFAGRGILHSGVYAKSLGDYNADFNTKLSNLLQGKTDTLGDLNTNRNNFLRQLTLDRQAARQDAVRRRAQKLGL